jgi:hypothetical protein|tara:strand:+ start:122 stop:2923 length:2802 start_codon:yes stop_codon:yes gene_type:complete
MAISPQDYSLWSRMTGNRYPKTAREKAAVGPDVKKFVDNVAKQGAQGGKSEEKSKKVNITGKQIATGALGAGLVAGAVAVARRKGSRDAVNEFLRNLGDKPDVKTYTRASSTPPASSTPAPTQQQEYGGNVGPGVDAMQRKIESMGRSIESTSQKIDAFKKDLNLNQPASEVQTKSASLVLNKTPVSTKNVGQDPAKYLAALKSIDPSKLGNSEQQRLEFIIDSASTKVNQNQNQTPPSDKPPAGTITGRNLSPEEKEKARKLAEFEQFKINERSTSKSNIAAIRQAQTESGNLRRTEFNIKNNDEPTGGAVTKSPAPKPPNLPSGESEEFYSKDELEAMRGIDKLLAGNNESTSQKVDRFVKTGVRTGQPKKVATDVTNTALGQNADNLISKPNEIIGNPTLKSKHDTEMKATQIIRDQRDIANFKNERNKIYDRVLNQLTNGDSSKIDERTERRASRLANKVINNDPGYQADRNRYNQAIKNTVSRDTELSAQDAQFQATRIYNEETGKEMTQDSDDGGKPLKRSMKNIKSVDNLRTGQQTANKRAIRGRGRNLDQGELPEEDTRDVGEADGIKDVSGGLIGSPLASTVGLPTSGGGLTEAVDVPTIVRTEKFNPNTGKTQTVSNVVIKQTTGALPLGEGKQARAPRGQVRRVIEASSDPENKKDFVVMDGKRVQRETLSGYGPYGKEVGKFISGAMDKEGNYSKEAAGFVSQGSGEELYDAGGTFKDTQGKTRFLRNQPGAPQPRKPSEPLFGPEMGVDKKREKTVANQSNEQLRSRIATDRSGKLTKTSRDAKIELLRRGATIPAVPASQDERESRIRFAGPGGTGEAKPTVTFNAPSTRLESGQRGPASSLQDRPPVGGSDPGSKKTLGVDFTRQQQQRATQGLRDIERNLPLDERPAARQKLIEELKETRRIKEGGSYDLSKDIQDL